MANILALGAEGKSSFTLITRSGMCFMAPVPDLVDIYNIKSFEQTLRELLKEKNVVLDYIVCDLHPEYYSTKLAYKLKTEYPKAHIVKIQHHFAHIVSCMADNRINGEVIGVSFDGTGFGDDGCSWGGEFFISTRSEYTRKKHLRYIKQPGSDMASREGWRMALSYLYGVYGSGCYDMKLQLLGRVDKYKQDIVSQMLEKDINCPLTSSAGRLFDAVASLTDIKDVSDFEAEAAILLENAVKKGVSSFYDYEINGEEIDTFPMIRAIVNDVKKGIEKEVISAKFHNTLGEIIFSAAKDISDTTGITKVVVSGGCFQNNYLTDYIDNKFKGSGMELFKHSEYSATDLNVSIGQAVSVCELKKIECHEANDELSLTSCA